MKKILFIFSLFICVQAAKAQDVHFGLKAGVNAANLIYKNQGEAEFKPGVHGGLLAHIHLFDHFALQPEIIYSAQGAKHVSHNAENKTNLNYLNVPVLVQYMFNNGFRLQAGPQVGFLLSANHEVNDIKANRIQNFKSTDFSIPVGVSYLHSSGLGVDARWTFGITNINSVGNRLPDTRNSVGQFGLFYMLNYGPGNHH
ncbi:porin family protein [Adhaeribacter aquaticus]|uniref:porin family protein n=1 Tax=Adhaeribacter aquaticus TaxID=299567 RepID=UPI0004292E59|nr:porin family protein [Adhaeribacter aquaticus]